VLAEPVDWARPGPVPIIRLPRSDAAALVPGQRALARVLGQEASCWRGRLLRAAPELPPRIVGVVRRGPGGPILEPADRRLRLEFALVPAPGVAAPADGELVVAAPLPVRRFERPRAQVLEQLGDARAPRAASAIALALHDIPMVFAPEALAESAAMMPAPLADRVDLRALALVTIDGEDARDFDDAVFAEPDPDMPTGWRILVAIADVAWYVRQGSALDRDAARRGNSVYFPDRVVPMLPERLSNDLCSLRPATDRPVLVAEMAIGADGRLRRHRFLRAMMRSAGRLTYTQAQTFVDGDSGALPATLHAPVTRLFAAWRALAAARDARGALDLDSEERAVRLDTAGRILSIDKRPRLDAHRLIEEFMILANVAAAETIERLHQPCLYRVHDRPAPERLEALRISLDTLGYRLAKGQAPHPALLRDVLRWAAGRPCAPLVNDLVLRSQALAVYSPATIGHFGLALSRYAHFTSPIRRYADLVVHRALIAGCGLGDGAAQLGHGALEELGERVSRAERRAQAAERAALARYVAAHLADQVGCVFDGRIAAINAVGLVITLVDSGAEGFVKLSALPGRWRAHPAGHAIEGPRSLALGDMLRVRLIDCAPTTGALLLAPDWPQAPQRATPARVSRRKRRGKN
jgi:ribonuclease R